MLYEHLAKTKVRKPSKEECMHLMTKQTSIHLREKDAMICYAMSQQTVPDLVRNSYLRLQHIDLLEFNEMIARVADVHFCDLDIPLHQKIEKVLDEWLGIIGELRKEPVYFEGNDSD
jgi:hypothetical protein